MKNKQRKNNANTVGAAWHAAQGSHTMRPLQINNQSAITLIALIITIIIMLILAGVVLNLTLGEHGIFKTAQNAASEYEKTKIKEEIELAVLDIEHEEIALGNEITLEKIKEKLPEKLNNITADLEDSKIAGEYKGYEYEIDNKFNVTIGENNETILKGINLKAWQDESMIKIKVSGTEQISKITILRPDEVTYVKECNNETNIQMEYPTVVQGEYKITVESDTLTKEKSITLKQTQVINGETYYLIYGVADLKEFMTKVENGETNINAKLMNDVNENLYVSRNLEYVNLNVDGNNFISTNIDPNIYIKDLIDIQDVSAAYIEFEEELPQDLQTQIFYAQNGKYIEQQRIEQLIRKGTKETVINLPNGSYCFRFDIGMAANVRYKIKKLSYIPEYLEENNWNTFLQVFKGKLLGNRHKIIILKNDLEYGYENLFESEDNYSNHLNFEQNKATIIGGDPYISYDGNYKNVCGLKIEISPNLMEQYFWSYGGRGMNEGDSCRTNVNEIGLPTMDFDGLRFDFNHTAVGQTITINGLYYKYCLDSKKIIYDENGETIEEFYAKDMKMKEENKAKNLQFSNLTIEQIAPNV